MSNQLTRVRLFGLGLGLGLVLVIPSVVEAQDAPPPGPPPAQAELVFEREIFRYPAFPRQNPFRALVGADSGGPTFDDLTLIGIMYSENPAASVAILTTGDLVISEDGTITATDGETYTFKVGERRGNMTIFEINRDFIVVDVEEFGLTDRKTLQFLPRLPGGTP